MNEDPTIAPAGSATFGKYHLLATLGRGGMAEVDLALCRGPMGFNKLVVLKRILPNLAEDPQFTAMFLDEARLAARLNHPNVVQTNEVGEGADGYFMAMEYLDGQPLNRILARVGRDGLPLSMHLRVLADALAGLHHAHELADYDGQPLGVVHRDVSPHNLFITYDGHVKVVDFGIAKARSSISHTQIGVVKGKVTYMAPEQGRMEPVDCRADVFSVGVMLWEAVTGVRLWAGKTDGAILKSLFAGEIPSPRSINPTIPERLEAIIVKALSPRREDRHATAAELQGEIEAFLDDSGAHVHTRDLGQIVAECFASERARIRAVIDHQLESVESGVPAPALPLLEHVTGSAPDRPRSSRNGTRVDGSGAFPSRAPAVLPVPVRSAPARRATWMVGGAGILAAAIAAEMWAQPVGRGPVATADAATPTIAAVTSHVEAPRDYVELEVSVWPRSAMIFVDDRAIGGNPGKAHFPRDGEVHQLRFEAPQHAARIEEITLDRDRAIELVLEKIEPEAGAKTAVLVGAKPHAVTSAVAAGAMPARPPAKANVEGRIIRTDLP